MKLCVLFRALTFPLFMFVACVQHALRGTFVSPNPRNVHRQQPCVPLDFTAPKAVALQTLWSVAPPPCIARKAQRPP